ncbi:MAG: Co2+/Mg2+ efflux protein ApaG [Bernardetiaceae bacterium]|jgi:ApaG protein|nr:Co2+/Mg2+ efflux protein ApaG [Bernardetiaceae bacterium]
MTTTTEITQGVKVTVKTEYKLEYSRPLQMHHVFTYHITIENNSDYTVQLLRRHWNIYDANGTVAEVEGEGVIGEQPVIGPGERHEYASGCHLKSGIGKMRGSYLMERFLDGKKFRVGIPEFTLMAPYLNN